MENKNQNINKKEIKSISVEGPFYEGLSRLENQGYRVISLEENARLRMQEGGDSYASKNHNWVREGEIYIPKNNSTYITKNSPIISNFEKAIKYDKSQEYFYLANKQIETLLQDSVKIHPNSKLEIPTDRFDEEEVTNFCFGEVAKDYGLFLKDLGVSQMEIGVTGEKVCDYSGYPPFANQLYMDKIRDHATKHRGVGSSDYYSLPNNKIKVRGILKEGLVEGIFYELPYTEEQASKIFWLVEDVRKGKVPNSKLEEALTFLEKLKVERNYP